MFSHINAKWFVDSLRSSAVEEDVLDIEAINALEIDFIDAYHRIGNGNEDSSVVGDWLFVGQTNDAKTFGECVRAWDREMWNEGRCGHDYDCCGCQRSDFFIQQLNEETGAFIVKYSIRANY